LLIFPNRSYLNNFGSIVKKATLIFSVTNDLSYDQRMQRICSTLATNGYKVLLVGRRRKSSIPLQSLPFQQKRLNCFFDKGLLFYIEYNIKLFFYLLFQPANALCAIDLDTILPVWAVSTLKKLPRLYDAHELFTEQKEIISRKHIHRFWLAIEQFAVPKFKNGYTVNEFIVQELNRRYQVQYGIIRNMPVKNTINLSNSSTLLEVTNPTILYQGAVNEGRCFETLIPAMQLVNAHLLIIGTGNFFHQTKALIEKYELQHKITLAGAIEPFQLKQITPLAFCGLTLFENKGLNQFYSLANRFFDYIEAGIPQIAMNYPEYAAINNLYNIALLINEPTIEQIAKALNNLLQNDVLYNKLKANTAKASRELNWHAEEEKLLAIWQQIIPVN